MTESFLKLYTPTICGTPLVHIFQNSRILSSVRSITSYGLLASKEEGEGFQSRFNNKFGKKRNIQIKSLSLMGSYAPPSRQATRLPLLVEYQLEELGKKYGVPPAEEVARQKLAAVGEHAALDILSKISRSPTVRTLTGYIIRMVEKTEAIPVDEGPRWHCNESQTSMSLSMADSDDISSSDDRSSEDGATQCPSPSSDEELSPMDHRQMQRNVDEDLANLSKKFEVWKAFGNLDFPKAFLVLNYVTPYQLEDVLRVEVIHDLQGMRMADVESRLRQEIALKPDLTFHLEGKLLEQFKPSTPWRRPVWNKGMPQPKPADFSYTELEDKLIEEFLNLRFAPSNSIGIAADSWMVYMDRLLTPRVEDPRERQTLKEKILELTDIYYEALDAPKTGKKVEVPTDL